MPSPTHVRRSDRCLHMSIGCPRREVRDTSCVTLPIRSRESAIIVGGSLVTPPWRFKACFDIRMVLCQKPLMPSPTHVRRSDRCLHMSIGCPRREVRDTSCVTLPIRSRESAIIVGGSLVTPPWRFKACFDIRVVPCQNPPMPSPTHVRRSNRCLHMSIGCPRREVRDTSRVTLPIRTRESAITVGGSLVAPPWCNSHRNGSISEGFVTAVRVVDYLLLRQRL